MHARMTTPPSEAITTHTVSRVFGLLSFSVTESRAVVGATDPREVGFVKVLVVV